MTTTPICPVARGVSPCIDTPALPPRYHLPARLSQDRYLSATFRAPASTAWASCVCPSLDRDPHRIAGVISSRRDQQRSSSSGMPRTSLSLRPLLHHARRRSTANYVRNNGSCTDRLARGEPGRRARACMHARASTYIGFLIYPARPTRACLPCSACLPAWLESNASETAAVDSHSHLHLHLRTYLLALPRMHHRIVAPPPLPPLPPARPGRLVQTQPLGTGNAGEHKIAAVRCSYVPARRGHPSVFHGCCCSWCEAGELGASG